MASESNTNLASELVPDALNELWNAGDKAKTDIVFVHGLRGHPQRTWEGNWDGSKVFWPKDLLPTTLPESRILSFGYPTEFATFYPILKPGLIPHTSIDDNSTSFVIKLANYRRESKTQDRPIIFVTHSLGGLVCANALSGHYESGEQLQVVNSTCGVIFLGTPFKGSDKAPWPIMAEKFLGLFAESNDQIVKDLDKKSSKLQQISDAFHKLLRERFESETLNAIQIACFFETKSTTKTWWKMKKDLGQIVTQQSAALAGYNAIPINADHVSMCRFEDDQTTGYIDVTNTMKLMVSNWNKKDPNTECNGRTVITFGDVRHGDNVINHGNITGHVYGTTPDANRISTANTITYNSEPRPSQGT